MNDIIEFKFISQIKKEQALAIGNKIAYFFLFLGLFSVAIIFLYYAIIRVRDPFPYIMSLVFFSMIALFIYAIYCEMIVKITLGPDIIRFTIKGAILGFGNIRLNYNEITKVKFGKTTMMIYNPKGFWDTVYIDGLSPSDLDIIKDRLIKEKIQIVPYKTSKKKSPSDITKKR